MKREKNRLEKKNYAFDSLNKQEMREICGSGGYFVWDSTTKTMWWVHTD